MQTAVGSNKPVTVEVIVTRHIETIVSAIGINGITLRCDLQKGLIYKIPDIATLHFRVISTNGIPIVFETTKRISHSMCVLCLYKRFWRFSFLYMAYHIFRRYIHRAIDICSTHIGTFVLYRTGSISVFNPMISFFKVFTHTGFITQRPNDYRWMVFIPFYHTLVSFQVLVIPFWLLGQRFFPIAHTMSFQIGFIYDIHSIAVTQFVPIRIVGIMAGTYCIDVVFLHNPDVLLHSFFRNNIACFRIHFMSVDSFY